jgi:FHS family glucose/mannose:H+ symporter-like MFS transporter
MTPQTIDDGAAARQKFLLVLLFAGFVLTGVEITLAGPMLPVFIARWSLSDSQAGTFFTVQFTASLVGVWVASFITHHVGSRVSLVAGYLLMAVGLASVNASTMGMAMFALGALGGGYGLVVPGTNLAVADIGGKKSASLVSLVNFAWSVGSVSCSPLVLLALKSGLLTKMLYVFAACGCLLTFSFLFAHFPGGKHVDPATGEKRAVPQVALLTTGALAGMFFLYVGIETSVGGWVAAYAKRLGGGAVTLATLAPMFFYGGLLVGRAGAPLALRKLHEYRLAIGSLALVVAGLILLVAASGQKLAFISIALAGLGCAAIFPICITWLSRWYGAGAGRMSGVMFSMSSLGSSAMPWILGFVSTHAGGLRVALLVPLSCAGIMSVLLLLLRRHASA